MSNLHTHGDVEGVTVTDGVILGVLVIDGVIVTDGVCVGVTDGHCTGPTTTPLLYSFKPVPRSTTPVNVDVHPTFVNITSLQFL